MRSKYRAAVDLICLILATAAVLGSSTSAATRTWTGAGGNSFWGNAANWSGGIPVNGDDVLVWHGGRRRYGRRSHTHAFGLSFCTGDSSRAQIPSRHGNHVISGRRDRFVGTPQYKVTAVRVEPI